MQFFGIPPNRRSGTAFLLVSLCMAVQTEDIASPQTDAVMGRAPTVATPVFVKKSASGKNPAIDDQGDSNWTTYFKQT
jgi:hypothetical protein